MSEKNFPKSGALGESLGGLLGMLLGLWAGVEVVGYASRFGIVATIATVAASAVFLCCANDRWCHSRKWDYGTDPAGPATR